MSKAAAAPTHKSMMKFAKSLYAGIVGLPNVGKSLLFNLLAKRDLAGTANYPFCTIEPNLARVEVPDERFTHLCELFKPKKQVPATLNVYDIAGLVRGASTGEGLGNEFLSNIRQCTAIYHCVRCFDDPDVVHVEGKVDPVRDMEIITNELRLKDIEWITKTFTELDKHMKSEPMKYKDEYAICQKVKNFLEIEQKPLRAGDWNAVETEWIGNQFFLTAKPNIFLLNMDAKSFVTHKNRHLPAAIKWIQALGTGEPIIPFSAKFEEELEKLPVEEQAAKLQQLGTKSALPKIIQTGFHDLGLINFFTCGPDEVRGWIVRNGATAPIAGGVIHSDFQELFIRAMVYHYDDIKECGSENAVKAAGKYRTEGKNYVVQDGDIMFFLHGSKQTKK